MNDSMAIFCNCQTRKTFRSEFSKNVCIFSSRFFSQHVCFYFQICICKLFWVDEFSVYCYVQLHLKMLVLELLLMCKKYSSQNFSVLPLNKQISLHFSLILNESEFFQHWSSLLFYVQQRYFNCCINIFSHGSLQIHYSFSIHEHNTILQQKSINQHSHTSENPANLTRNFGNLLPNQVHFLGKDFFLSHFTCN